MVAQIPCYLLDTLVIERVPPKDRVEQGEGVTDLVDAVLGRDQQAGRGPVGACASRAAGRYSGRYRLGGERRRLEKVADLVPRLEEVGVADVFPVRGRREAGLACELELYLRGQVCRLTRGCSEGSNSRKSLRACKSMSDVSCCE